MADSGWNSDWPIRSGASRRAVNDREWDPNTAEPERIRNWKTYKNYIKYVEIMKDPHTSDEEKITQVFEDVFYFSKESMKNTARVALQQVIDDYENENWDD